MNKSVYSLVLADEVVEAIDRMAYSMNTSRSNLINQILAERVSLMTPEMRMRQIFSEIEQLMDPRFLFIDQPSDSMIAIKSPVRYKYKPTLRYSLELSRDMQGKVGRLKVSFRTKSEQLTAAANGFFELWLKLENKYLRKVFPDGVPAQTENGRYTRDLYSPIAEHLSDKEIAGAVAGYIRLMDSCIQTYFDGLTEGRDRSDEIGAAYAAYVRTVTAVI
ncbi:hypothetical protein [Ruminococcus albus]|uniref:Ribbon-helix-helix protein CopG domain-containing protein n=1 Tax=Ruminococcus albus TaxID=1264 RepID=A0A1I1HMJ9_RUMAL|nr:hypothetical protein [Ruminococcus albus]SFC22280.1 hypothetical protein SAMN02910406_01344 [Ruminococcus albus]